jgi:hypothetical protein
VTATVVYKLPEQFQEQCGPQNRHKEVILKMLILDCSVCFRFSFKHVYTFNCFGRAEIRETIGTRNILSRKKFFIGVKCFNYSFILSASNGLHSNQKKGEKKEIESP